MNNMEEKHREYRELEDTTKEKISQSLTNRPKSETHKLHISQGMKKYWQKIPSKKEDISMDDFLNGVNKND